MLVVVTSAGCSTAPSKKSGQPPDQPYYERSRMMIDDVDAPLEINDPWEGMNRSIYRFNSYADRYVLNPAVSAYRFVFPGFVRKGISNFFDEPRQHPDRHQRGLPAASGQRIADDGSFPREHDGRRRRVVGSGHADRYSAALRRLRADARALGRWRRTVRGAAVVRPVIRCAMRSAEAVDAADLQLRSIRCSSTTSARVTPTSITRCSC